MIRYDRLWATMEASGMTQYRLIKQYSFSAGQIGRLKKNMHVSTHTLDTLCSILDCDISDIIEYVPDGLTDAVILPAGPSGTDLPVPESAVPGKDEGAPTAKQKKAESSKTDKPKKAGKSKKGDKKAAKDGKKGKDGKKNK